MFRDIIDIAGRPELKNQQWEKAEKCDLANADERVCAYYVCTKSDEEAVRSTFGEYKAISLRDGEFAFITPAMKKADFDALLAKLDVISSLDIL